MFDKDVIIQIKYRLRQTFLFDFHCQKSLFLSLIFANDYPQNVK